MSIHREADGSIGASGLAAAGAQATLVSLQERSSPGESIRGLCMMRYTKTDPVESPCRNLTLRFVGADGKDAGAVMPAHDGRFSWAAEEGKEYRIHPGSRKFQLTLEPIGPVKRGQTVLIHATPTGK
jgi:hypothetical protein